MKRLNHPNIVKLTQFMESNNYHNVSIRFLLHRYGVLREGQFVGLPGKSAWSSFRAESRSGRFGGYHEGTQMDS